MADRGGAEGKELRLRMDVLRAIAYSPRLPHLVEVNGFFARLTCRCRESRGLRLSEWWSEQRSAAEWGGLPASLLRRCRRTEKNRLPFRAGLAT